MQRHVWQKNGKCKHCTARLKKRGSRRWFKADGADWTMTVPKCGDESVAKKKSAKKIVKRAYVRKGGRKVEAGYVPSVPNIQINDLSAAPLLSRTNARLYLGGVDDGVFEGFIEKGWLRPVFGDVFLSDDLDACVGTIKRLRDAGQPIDGDEEEAEITEDVLAEPKVVPATAPVNGPVATESVTA